MPYAIAFDDALLDISDARFDTAKAANDARKMLGMESAFAVRIDAKGRITRLRPARKIQAIGTSGKRETITYGEACRVYRSLMHVADVLAEQYPHARDPLLAAYDDENVERRVYFAIVRRVAEMDMRQEAKRESATLERIAMLYAKDKPRDTLEDIADERTALNGKKIGGQSWLSVFPPRVEPLADNRVNRIRAILYARLHGIDNPNMNREMTRLMGRIDVDPQTHNGADIDNAISDSIARGEARRTANVRRIVPYNRIVQTPQQSERNRIMRQRKANRREQQLNRITREREYARLVFSRKESLPVASDLVRMMFPSKMPSTLQWAIEPTTDILTQRERDRLQRETAATWAIDPRDRNSPSIDATRYARVRATPAFSTVSGH